MSASTPDAAPAVTPQLLRSWSLPRQDEGGTKHERGTVLIVGGADSTPGAVLLAGLAALRVGAGRLQLATVQATAVGLAVALPEAMVLGLPAGPSGSLASSTADTIVEQGANAATVVLGPGLLDRDEAAELLSAVLPRLTCRQVVLDAVALTALATLPARGDAASVLNDRYGLVLTPNDGELAALVGADEPSGLAGAREAAARFGAVVATRGWVVTSEGQTWRNEAGGVGLGTSGSGDVLAGVVGGLLARGADPAQAAVWGQYAHAAAGDRLTSRLGRLGFLARELLDELPAVMTSLSG